MKTVGIDTEISRATRSMRKVKMNADSSAMLMLLASCTSANLCRYRNV